MIKEFELNNNDWLWVEELENGVYLVELHTKDDFESLRDSKVLIIEREEE